MKTFKIFLAVAICVLMAGVGHSQKTRAESIKVSGECGVCKKNIEKAAHEAGAAYAAWDQHTKILKLTFSAGTDVSAIQQRIADAGYDTPLFRATDEAYNRLDKCCQYERQELKKPADCCASTECRMTDGSCANMSMCKDKTCCKDNPECIQRNCCEKAAESEKSGPQHNNKLAGEICRANGR